jgi:NAD(P)H dehydrogenase (quinone)
VLRIPYPPKTRLSLVNLDDVAEIAAQVSLASGHAGATYELVGTGPLSQTEVANTIGAALGRAVRVEEEPLEAWDSRARAAGMGEHECATLIAMFRCYASHGLIGNPNTLRWLLGRAPSDLPQFAASVRSG